MKKIIFFMMGISCSAFALEENPIAPPKADIVDKFGVNLQTGQLARTLNTVSIGGDLGLSHSVQLYTDLFLNGDYYGFVDGFAGRAKPENISQNSVYVMPNANGDPAFFRDTGARENDHAKRISVIRVYGPAGSQDFLVYHNGVLNGDASAYSGTSTATGLTFKAMGDSRHTLVQTADKKSLIWTRPDGTESKYTSNPETGHTLVVTYPNGLKVRVGFNAVTTNTGFMLKYQSKTPGLSGTYNQIVALNRAHQYCSENGAIDCPSTGWPTATFTWPVGTPTPFYQLGLPASNYTIKMTTEAGVTDIQYHPEDVCKKQDGNVDDNCARSRPGRGRWVPRLRSIKTPESIVPNYAYEYENRGAMYGASDGYSIYSYWNLSSEVGQIRRATFNGTDSRSYSTSTNSYNARLSWSNGETWVESALYDINVIETVTDKKGGTYIYLKDSRNLVEFHTPVAGGGPKKHFYYEGPKGNLSKITAVTSVGETLLQEASYEGYVNGVCSFPKTCNKPTKIKDARGNITTYEYDPQGRFSSPVKITSPADKNNKKSVTVYNYEPLFASYKKDGESIAQDSDPVWMLRSEFTCRTTDAASCASTSPDVVKTEYYYGPQNSGLANNLFLRGKSVSADGAIRVTCYEYDKYGNKIGETSPKGNSTNLQSCP